MALSWNEIKERAVRFSKEWINAGSENAEAQSFLNDFFDVFGVSRKRVGTFELKIKKLNETDGYIDLIWKGVILIEMKSFGKDLDKAFEQAKEYVQGLKESEVPKYILVCDFRTFRLYDTEELTTIEFKIVDFVKNIHHFSFVAGYQKRTYKEQDPVNIKAAELLGKLHDRLKEVGYTGHPLEVFLVRLLFCLFAEDTTIFNKLQFQDFIEQRTSEDGSDLAAKLQELFQILNVPKQKRLTNLDEQLDDFPYVNGKLFEETLPIASFDRKMRQALLDCCYLDWSKISPAIFGSMFQSVMKPEERRNLGAHYTSEKNILKLIKPLFLDELYEEFERCKDSKPKLTEFHRRLKDLRFLDPACGCGNFLVIAYRELRLLEIKILKKLYKSDRILDVSEILWLDVDMMYGIECEEFAARISEVAMWLIDHQMNMLASEEFGQYFARLPLRKAANIIHGNALRIDWAEIVPKAKLSYIMGNPPFVGKQYQTNDQKDDMRIAFSNIEKYGVLDYVAAWYVVAARFIKNTDIRVAFVSTNSITQGEQCLVIWGILFGKFGVIIHFAHRAFGWHNEARGKAAVHVVIIGFGIKDSKRKRIFEYDDPSAEPHEILAKNINGYLIDAPNILIRKTRKPISDVPEIAFGSMPNDGGHLLFTDAEKKEFLEKEPSASKFFRKFIGSEEFIYGTNRWCLWLKDARPADLAPLREVMSRIAAVKKNRLDSKRPTTQELAKTPAIFGEIRQPETDYLVFPEVSSEKRHYIPIGFMKKEVITSNKNYTISKPKLYHFGVLTSHMHMTWVRHVAGRLESRYQYSAGIVYNNFPWPEEPSDKQIKAIEKAAQKILEVRTEFSDSSLAILYDPLTMPPKLVKAHSELDKVVDLAYRSHPFPNDARRMEFLFELYGKYTANLFETPKKKKV